MKITPETHQKQALKDIRKGIKKHDRGQVLMATGTGKSLVALWAAREHVKDSILVLVPSLALARQIYLEWRREDVENNATKLPWMVVCSDASVTDDEDGSRALKDLEQETKGGVIRDPGAIYSFLSRKQAGPAIVISTYQSAPVLAEGLPPKFKFGIAIFDEAHKTAGSAGKLFGFALQDKNLPCRKRLFFTATPRIGDYVTPKKEEATIFHMNDQAVYGPVFHDLSFNKAKELGLVVGYDVVVAVLQDQQVQRSDISNDKDAALLAKVIMASQAAQDYDIQKMFSFHDSNLNAAKAKVFYQNQAKGFNVERVEGSQSAKERGNVLSRFMAANRSIITNARCLGEGVNVPSCDAVAFMTPRRSRVDVVQAVGRACRIKRTGPRKKKAFVVLPIFLEAGETIEDAMNNSSFKDAMATLNILKDYNTALSDRIRETKGYVPPGPEENPGPGRLDEDQIHILAMGTLTGEIAGLTIEEFKKSFKTQVANSTYGPEQRMADILALARAAKIKEKG